MRFSDLPIGALFVLGPTRDQQDYVYRKVAARAARQMLPRVGTYHTVFTASLIVSFASLRDHVHIARLAVKRQSRARIRRSPSRKDLTV